MNMNTNQKKQEQLNRGIAIAVAVLLALTLIVTVIAFSTSKRSDEKTPALTTTRTTQTTATKSTSQTSSTPAPTTGTSASTVKPPEGTGSSDDKPTAVLAPDFTCPLAGALVKDYSADIPVFSITMEDYRVHCGIDIGADAGTEVLAAADGDVIGLAVAGRGGKTGGGEDGGELFLLHRAGGVVATAGLPRTGDLVKIHRVLLISAYRSRPRIC